MEHLLDFLFERRDNIEAREKPGIPGDKLESGSYWWATAEDMIQDLKKFCGRNTKKIMTSKFEEAIKQCYKNVPENPTYKDVPFVVKLGTTNEESNQINPAQIFIRRNVSYKSQVKDILANYGISKEGSGFGKSAGNEFEDDLAKEIQLYVTQKYIFKISPIKGAYHNLIVKLFKELNKKYNLDKVLKTRFKDVNIDDDWCVFSTNGTQIGKIKDTVEQTGASNTKRNKNGEIIDINTMKFNYSNTAEVFHHSCNR